MPRLLSTHFSTCAPSSCRLNNCVLPPSEWCISFRLSRCGWHRNPYARDTSTDGRVIASTRWRSPCFVIRFMELSSVCSPFDVYRIISQEWASLPARTETHWPGTRSNPIGFSPVWCWKWSALKEFFSAKKMWFYLRFYIEVTSLFIQTGWCGDHHWSVDAVAGGLGCWRCSEMLKVSTERRYRALRNLPVKVLMVQTYGVSMAGHQVHQIEGGK